MFKKDRYINNWSKRCFKFAVILLIVGLSSSAWGVIESDDFSLNRKWTGDYDGMLERRRLRVLTPYNKTFYFLDGGTEKGLAYQGVITSYSIHYTKLYDLLDDAREQLRLQFAELATSILDEKSAHFSKKSEEKLSTLLVPFHDQLSSFRQKVDAVHHAETRDRAALQREIASLRTLNQQMSDEAINLTRALKGDKLV